jgi:protein-disulfide isomerase
MLTASVFLSGSAPAVAADAVLFTAPSSDAQVGLVGDVVVTYSELPDALRQQLRQNEERYARRRMALDFEYKRAQRAAIDSTVSQTLDQKALDLEANAQKTTADKLLASISVAAVTDAQIQAFYDQRRDQLKRPLEEARGQLSEYLQSQARQSAARAYLDGLRAKYAAQATLEPLREEVPPIGPARGTANAPVTIIEFADFQCPYCARMAPVLRQLLAKYPHQVRVVYREFPLSEIHPNAWHAAVAGVCADQQGKFWELHDALFADQRALGDEAVMKTAERVGIKLQPFASCLLSAKAADSVRGDLNAGDEVGVGGTPGLFVNGRFYDGYMPLETISGVVEDELHRRGRRSGTATSTAASTPVPPVTQR